MKNSHSILSTLFLLATLTSFSALATEQTLKNSKEIIGLAQKKSSIDHSAFNNLLQTYVAFNGNVNYAGLFKNKNALKNYISSLTKVNPSNLSRNEKLAYWINAYNALTLDQIIDHYPTTSILKIANGKVWDQTLAYQFNGENISLDQIEKKILLGSDLFDARIHFSVNCAAISCPKLSNKAFTANNVQTMLTQNTITALANQSQNKIATDKASISMLFDWYKADFEKAEGSVINFINKYSSVKLNSNTKINYLEYNWNLNGK
jgi:hypothetical protein